MDYADFILPWLIHPAGHLTSGNSLSGNARMNYDEMSEKWRGPIRAYRNPMQEDLQNGNTMIVKDRDGMDCVVVPIYDEKSQALFGGAGFEAQDRMGEAKRSSSYDLGNAMHKAMYLGGMHKLSGATEGDLKQMERNSGNKAVNAMLAVTAIDDLASSADPEKNWRLMFHVRDGAPGVLFSVPLDADMKPVMRRKK